MRLEDKENKNVVPVAGERRRPKKNKAKQKKRYHITQVNYAPQAEEAKKTDAPHS